MLWKHFSLGFISSNTFLILDKAWVNAECLITATSAKSRHHIINRTCLKTWTRIKDLKKQYFLLRCNETAEKQRQYRKGYMSKALGLQWATVRNWWGAYQNYSKTVSMTLPGGSCRTSLKVGVSDLAIWTKMGKNIASMVKTTADQTTAEEAMLKSRVHPGNQPFLMNSTKIRYKGVWSHS